MVGASVLMLAVCGRRSEAMRLGLKGSERNVGLLSVRAAPVPRPELQVGLRQGEKLHSRLCERRPDASGAVARDSRPALSERCSGRRPDWHVAWHWLYRHAIGVIPDVALSAASRRSTAALQVLMLSDVYFPRVNGVSTSIRATTQSLVRAGHAVTLVAPDYGDAAQKQHDTEFGDRFQVLRLPARHIFFDPEDRLMRVGSLRGALSSLVARTWDVVHVHTPFRAHQLGIRLRKVTGCSVVESYHTYFEAYVAHYLPWLPRALSEAFARRMSRQLCNAVDHVIVPTVEMAEVLMRYGVRTASTVLPTGLEMDEFREGDGETFRARYGIARDRPMLLTISRLAREKQIDFLLRVARELVPRFPALLFVVAGEGPDAPRLKALARELGLGPHVLFLGNLDRRGALLDCYRAADLFVFASPTETQGLVLIEAMALGVPIVSTAVMGTATVLRGARGACIAPEDVPRFAERVAELLLRPERRAALAAAGPGDARAWNAGGMMRRLLAVYATAGCGRSACAS